MTEPAPAPRPLELRIESLSKTYSNGVEALKDVSLTIPRGNAPGSTRPAVSSTATGPTT